MLGSNLTWYYSTIPLSHHIPVYTVILESPHVGSLNFWLTKKLELSKLQDYSRIFLQLFRVEWTVPSTYLLGFLARGVAFHTVHLFNFLVMFWFFLFSHHQSFQWKYLFLSIGLHLLHIFFLSKKSWSLQELNPFFYPKLCLYPYPFLFL
jgi:hypothetical protein